MRYEVHTTDVPGSIPCRVIAKLQARSWRVIVGVGVGQLDGGVEHDWAEDDLPAELRKPNATFFVSAGHPAGRVFCLGGMVTCSNMRP